MPPKMRRKTIILLTDNEGIKKPYSTLSEMCRKNPEFSYYYLRDVKLPHIYKGKYRIERLKLNK